MGKQNGHGTVMSKDWKYVGEWKGIDFHGQGTMISTDGTKLVGDFRGNKPWLLSLFSLSFLCVLHQEK